MPLQRNEETGNLEYVPFHRTPKEKRLKKIYCERAGHFIAICFLLSVYQILKRIIIMKVGDSNDSIILPFFKHLSFYIIVTMFFYTSFNISIFHSFIYEKKGGDTEKAMFGMVCLGIYELIIQIIEIFVYVSLKTYDQKLDWFIGVTVSCNIPFILLLFYLYKAARNAENAYDDLKQYQRRLESKPKTREETTKIDIKKLIQMKKQRFSYSKHFIYRKKI